jgi:hypothetical protein
MALLDFLRRRRQLEPLPPRSDGGKPFNALISFPRSGTDFFCEALSTDPRIRYFREYFNPICNPRRDAELRAHFGDERLSHYLSIMTEIGDEAFTRVLEATWLKDGHNTTKENFSATKFAHFAGRFNIIVQTRKVYHTFPTSRPDFVVPILNGFMLAGEYKALSLARELNELRRFIASDTAVEGVHHAGVLAHIVQHYILLHEAKRFGAPVLAYEDLALKTGTDLAAALQCLTLFDADPAPVAHALDAGRKTRKTNLAGRRARFRRECKVEWCTRPLAFIREMSPDIAGALAAYVFDDGEIEA